MGVENRVKQILYDLKKDAQHASTLEGIEPLVLKAAVMALKEIMIPKVG